MSNDTKEVKRPLRRPYYSPPPLSDEERVKFKAILNDPVFKLAIARVQNMKPSSLVTTGPQHANDRLHQICGWDLYEHALYLQASPPKAKPKTTEETYPDAGMIDYDNVESV